MRQDVLLSIRRVKSFNLEGGGEEWCLMSAVLARKQATGRSGIATLLGFLGIRKAMIFRSVFGSSAGTSAWLNAHGILKDGLKTRGFALHDIISASWICY